ncbi:Ribonuclease H2, subunit B [Naviculisporaceae sp. PSN 640]
MARTRSTKATGPVAEKKGAKSEGTAATSSTATYTLPEQTKTAPRVFILPKKATSEARIVTLQNPRYSKPTRYLVCPEAGFFEFTKITAPKASPRSWLLQQTKNENDGTKLDTQVTRSADLYIASPIDPLFLILPALVAKDSASADNNKKRMFLSSDDYFDSLSEMPDSNAHNHLSEILSWAKTRQLLELRMASVCDTVDAGDEHMFRLNESKLLAEILSKAKRMAEHGLPKSMEDKFVTKALEAPILSVRSTAAPAASPGTEDASSGTSTPSLESADSQSTISSVETTATAVSDASTAATEVSTDEVTNAMTAPAEVISLQKLRISFDFICSSYLAPSLTKLLKAQLPSSKTADFKPLEEYMTKLAELKQKAAAARITTDYSRKRTRDEEDDEKAEKKRKKDEEEKVKKANVSRGVEKLKKVNTTGMKKLSEFFKKKT